ncbi:hypothetical protein ACFWVM_29205 [Nocardia fluminea]|uniref:hypothetical protein n=1 Tax=Nocardia fluminea TaxID=134984 RepID=UPI0036482294
MYIERVSRPDQVQREVALHAETGVLVGDGVARALAQALWSDGDAALLAMALGESFDPTRIDLTGMDFAADPATLAALRAWLRIATKRDQVVAV